MSRILSDGRICHQTKPMRADLALRFARCLKANSRFTDVATIDAGQRGLRVVYRPVNRERQADLYMGQQTARRTAHPGRRVTRAGITGVDVRAGAPQQLGGGSAAARESEDADLPARPRGGQRLRERPHRHASAP